MAPKTKEPVTGVTSKSAKKARNSKATVEAVEIPTAPANPPTANPPTANLEVPANLVPPTAPSDLVPPTAPSDLVPPTANLEPPSAEGRTPAQFAAAMEANAIVNQAPVSMEIEGIDESAPALNIKAAKMKRGGKVKEDRIAKLTALIAGLNESLASARTAVPVNETAIKAMEKDLKAHTKALAQANGKPIYERDFGWRDPSDHTKPRLPGQPMDGVCVWYSDTFTNVNGHDLLYMDDAHPSPLAAQEFDLQHNAYLAAADPNIVRTCKATIAKEMNECGTKYALLYWQHISQIAYRRVIDPKTKDCTPKDFPTDVLSKACTNYNSKFLTDHCNLYEAVSATIKRQEKAAANAKAKAGCGETSSNGKVPQAFLEVGSVVASGVDVVEQRYKVKCLKEAEAYVRTNLELPPDAELVGEDKALAARKAETIFNEGWQAKKAAYFKALAAVQDELD